MANFTTADFKSASQVYEDLSCVQLEDLRNGQSAPCSEWVYDPEYGFSGLTKEVNDNQ